MKKIICTLLTFGLTFCLFGCSKNIKQINDTSAYVSHENSVDDTTSKTNSSSDFSSAPIKSSSSSSTTIDNASSSTLSKSKSSSSSSATSSPSSRSSSSVTSSTSETESKSEEIIHTYYKKSDNIKIFIIGNSFIRSSEIGRILFEMFSVNNTNATVENESIGYYTATRFLGDLQNGGGYFDSIKNGEYDLLFLSGFYSYQDALTVESILELLPEKTKLVLLPAQNEASYAPSVRNKFPAQHIVDWKGAIDSLYTQGFSKFELAFDDTHLHTNALGGYVGASMIYSYLYNEKPTPTTLSDYTELSSEKKTAIAETAFQKSKQ